MFVIKHSRIEGDELHEAAVVTFNRNSESKVPATIIWQDGAKLVNHCLWGGTAYVMNEAGQTVAKYELPYDRDADVAHTIHSLGAWHPESTRNNIANG